MSSRTRPRGGTRTAQVDARHAFDHAKQSTDASASISAFESFNSSALTPPSSSSSFHPFFPSSPPSSSSLEEAKEGEEEEVVPAKLLDFSQVHLLPPRRNNHPAYAAPPRTQSTRQRSPAPKRPLDDGGFSSSQPLPEGASYSADGSAPSESTPPSPIKLKTAHAVSPAASPEKLTPKPAAPSVPPAPASFVADEASMRSPEDEAPQTVTVTVQLMPAEAPAPVAPAVAPPVSAEASAESPFSRPSSLLLHLQGLSSVAYELSQYHLLLGLTHVQLGDFSSALSAFRQAEAAFHPAVDVVPASSFQPHRSHLKALQARASAEAAFQSRTADVSGADVEEDEHRGHYLENAKRLYSEAIAQEDGGRADLWNELALLLLRSGDLKAGVALYELLLSTYGDSADLFVNLAVLRQAYGESDVAVQYLQHVLASHPQHVTALVNYGLVLSSQGLHAESVRVLNLALHFHDANPVALNALGVELDLAGNAEQALVCFERARSVREGDHHCTTPLHLNLATHLTRQAREEVDDDVRVRELEAAQTLLRLELAKETAGKESQAAPLLHLAMGDVFAEMYRRSAASTHWEKAEAEYSEALRLNADDAELWNQLGLLYAAHEDQDKARAAFIRVLDRLPSSATPLVTAVPALNNLALLCIRQGSHAQAVALLTLAMAALSPKPSGDSPSPHSASPSASVPAALSVLVNLGRAHQLSGQLADAEAAYERCLRLQPDYFSALNGLTAVLAARGEWREAERRMEEALQAHGDGRFAAELRHNQLLLEQRRGRLEDNGSTVLQE